MQMRAEYMPLFVQLIFILDKSTWNKKVSENRNALTVERRNQKPWIRAVFRAIFRRASEECCVMTRSKNSTFDFPMHYLFTYKHHIDRNSIGAASAQLSTYCISAAEASFACSKN